MNINDAMEQLRNQPSTGRLRSMRFIDGELMEQNQKKDSYFARFARHNQEYFLAWLIPFDNSQWKLYLHDGKQTIRVDGTNQEKITFLKNKSLHVIGE